MSDAAKSTQTSLRIPADLLASLDRISAALDRDRFWVMLRAIRQYLDGEGGDVLREGEGLAALDRGEGVDFEAVQAEADAIVAQARSGHVRAAE
jgi:predicted transcriptional regulator